MPIQIGLLPDHPIFTQFNAITSQTFGGLSLRVILIDILKFVVGTIFLVALWKFVQWGFRWLTTKGDTLITTHGRTVRLGSKDILQLDQARAFFTTAMFWLKRAALAAVVILYANFVLSILPQTRGVASAIFSSIFTNLSQLFSGILGYLPKLIFLVILAILAYYAFKFISFFFREIENGDITLPGFDQEWAQPTARIAQIVTLSLFAVVAFPYLPGSGSEAFRGISILLGVLFSIGSSSVVSNLIAGILLTYTRAFRIGDDIEVDGVIGTVIEKGLLVIRIRNYSNQFVSIPNSTVLSSNVLNFRIKPDPAYATQPPPIICIKVCLPYKYHWKEIHPILIRAAHACPGILEEPPPEILHLELDTFHVAYELNAFCNEPTLETITLLKQAVQDQFAAAGIEMTVPQQVQYRTSHTEISPVPN